VVFLGAQNIHGLLLDIEELGVTAAQSRHGKQQMRVFDEREKNSPRRKSRFSVPGGTRIV
jgi:hypothetical protein